MDQLKIYPDPAKENPDKLHLALKSADNRLLGCLKHTFFLL